MSLTVAHSCSYLQKIELIYILDFNFVFLFLGVSQQVYQPSFRKESTYLKYVYQIFWSDRSFFNILYMIGCLTSGI